MSAPTTINALAHRLASAVDQTRAARHFPDCNCCSYRDSQNAGYCNRAERLAWMDIDRILEQIRRASF